MSPRKRLSSPGRGRSIPQYSNNGKEKVTYRPQSPRKGKCKGGKVRFGVKNVSTGDLSEEWTDDMQYPADQYYTSIEEPPYDSEVEIHD